MLKVTCSKRAPVPKPECNQARSRRQTLQALTLLTGVLRSQSDRSYAGVGDTDAISVGPDSKYTTINAALVDAPDGATLVIQPGRYTERLVLVKPVSLLAQQTGTVELVWETLTPYESTIECNSSNVVMSGLLIRHSSKSVANNYAVHLVDSSNVQMMECDISSTSGSGIGIEGGSCTIKNCTFHDCKTNGVMIFGSLEDNDGSGGTSVIEGCNSVNNQQHGVVIRSGAEPVLKNNNIKGNGGYGVVIQNSGGTVINNTASNNRKGSVAYDLLINLDIDALKIQNTMEGSIVNARL